MKNPIPVWLLALALLPCGLPFAGAAAEEPVAEETVALQPHRALYDISLRSAKSSSGIADIHGQMYFNMEESCTAWTTTHRFILVYDYIDNPTSQVVSEFKTVEAKDGSSLEYSARRVRDGEVQEEIEGKAVRPKKGRFVARYKKPEPMHIDLPAEAQFPTQQTIRTINGGLQKQKFLTGTVYDGSDTDGAYQVSGLILKPISEPERKRIWPKNVDRDLASQPGWRTQVAIFPLSNKDETSSDYEMDANLLQNGIITDMAIRYSDFSIGQSLKALTANPRPNCTPDAPVEKAETEKKP